MHSHKVDASKLDGKPGMSMESFFLSNEAEVVKNLSFLPMFLGPSLAITDWLPEKLTQWSQNGNNRKFSIADCLFQKKDIRIAKALAEYVVDLIPQYSPQKPFVILVDHGTPLPEVNQVREEIGCFLEEKLGNQISGFSTACMERRRAKNTILMIPFWRHYWRTKKSPMVVVLFSLSCFLLLAAMQVRMVTLHRFALHF